MARKTWTEDAIREVAKKYKTKNELKHGEPCAYSAARRLKLIGSLFSAGNRSWSREAIVEEAKKYSTRVEFRFGTSPAYYAAIRLGMMDELFGTVRTYWTLESACKKALDYASRNEFDRAHPSAAEWVRDAELMDVLFPEKLVQYLNDVVYIWRAVGEFYNGNPVYKIGITSSHLGTTRLTNCAKKAGMQFEIVCCETVKCKATSIEKKLLMLGESPKYEGFDGATEFRALSDAALYAAIAIISEST